MFVGQVHIDPRRRVVVEGRAAVREREALQVWIGQRLNSARRRRRLSNVREQLRDHRIGRGDLSVRGRERQQVDLPHAAARVVLEDALLRQRREDRALPRDLRRLMERFVVEEEERLVMTVEEPRQHDRTADAKAVLIQLHLIARRVAVRSWRQVAVVEPVVRVQIRVAQVMVDAPGLRVRPRARDEVDLHASLARALRFGRGRRDRHFLDRVQMRDDGREEAVAGLVAVVLHVDAIERDVDRALGQAVHRRVAVCDRRVDARQERDEIKRVARGERQLTDLADDHRRRHRRRLRLDDFGAT